MIRLLIPALALLVAVRAAPDSKAKPAMPSVAPMSYFEDKCSRCHGPHGSFYGDDFGKRYKSDKALHKVVEDMCRQQGDSPLHGADLEAEVAYHRAMVAGEPFLVVTKMEGQQMAGEVTEKAAVTVKFKRRTVPADVKGSHWTVAVPKGEKPENAVVTATLDRKSTALRVNQERFSHAKPIIQ